MVDKLSELNFPIVIKGSLALYLQKNLPHRIPQDIDLIINSDNSLRSNGLIFKELINCFSKVEVIHNNHFLKSFQVVLNNIEIKIEWITKHDIHKKWVINQKAIYLLNVYWCTYSKILQLFHLISMRGKVDISIQKIKNTIYDLTFLLKGDKWIKMKEMINEIIFSDWKCALFSYFSSNIESDFVMFLNFSIFIFRLEPYSNFVNSNLIKKIFFISEAVNTESKNRIFIVEYLVENKKMIMDILACNVKTIKKNEIYKNDNYKALFYENILSYKSYSDLKKSLNNLWVKILMDIFPDSNIKHTLKEEKIDSFFKKVNKKTFVYTIEEILDFISSEILVQLRNEVIKNENNK